MIAEGGGQNARDQWIYGIPGRVFAALRASGVTRRQTARLFGHSAGAQFSHRLTAVEDPGIFEAALAANAGWYTLPTLQKHFPEGLDALGLGVEQLAHTARVLAEFLAERSAGEARCRETGHDPGSSQPRSAPRRASR